MKKIYAQKCRAVVEFGAVQCAKQHPDGGRLWEPARPHRDVERGDERAHFHLRCAGLDGREMESGRSAHSHHHLRSPAQVR